MLADKTKGPPINERSKKEREREREKEKRDEEARAVNRDDSRGRLANQ